MYCISSSRLEPITGQSFPTQIWSLLVVLQVFYQVVLESNNVVLCRVSLKTTMFVLIRDAVMCSPLLLVEWRKYVNISDVTNHPPLWEVTREVTAGHSRQWQTTVWLTGNRLSKCREAARGGWCEYLHTTYYTTKGLLCRSRVQLFAR